MAGKRSRDKGKRGEREFAKFLKKHGFEDAKRGVQYKGTKDSPDVEGLEGFHIEVKRCEALRLYPSLKKAEEESSDDDVPIVAHRRNDEEWIIIMKADKFVELIQK